MVSFGPCRLSEILFGTGRIAALPTLEPDRLQVPLYDGEGIKRNSASEQVRSALEHCAAGELGGSTWKQWIKVKLRRIASDGSYVAPEGVM